MDYLVKVMGWVFAMESVGNIIFLVKRLISTRVLRYNVVTSEDFIVLLSLLITAVICGVACWAIWRNKSSSRGWGIAASLTYGLSAIRPVMFHTSHSGLGWTSLIIGVSGLIVFLFSGEQIRVD